MACSCEHQLFLAKRYGFPVPVGYTFVRPHERGTKAMDILYRSRSALRSLYTEIEIASAETPQWFQFERDVVTLLRDLGFKVHHLAASRRGDHGVDVSATKGHDLDEVRWLIQCKCFGPQHKVGPSVIREMLGALEGSGAGTKGMIVTTSSFTGGARELAREHGLRLINGQEFHDLLQRVAPQGA